jgi:hypothetical protein
MKYKPFSEIPEGLPPWIGHQLFEKISPDKEQ